MTLPDSDDAEICTPEDVCSWFLSELWPLAMGFTPKSFGRLECLVSKDKEFALLGGLHQSYVGDVKRGERSAILVTTDKLVRDFDFTLASGNAQH